MIPKILLQISKDPLPQYVQDMWKERTDDSWQIQWFDDAKIIEFFKLNPIPGFENIIQVFNSFKKGAHKADLFRYYFMYLNGGIFVDSDAMTFVSLNRFIREDLDYFFTTVKLEDQGLKDGEYASFNGFFGCIPNSKIVYDLLKNVYEVDTKLLDDHYLYFTEIMYYIILNHDPKNADYYLCNTWGKNRESVFIHDKDDTLLCEHWHHTKIVPIDFKLNKSITFFTTFNKDGLLLYGKHWISTFIKSTKGYDIKARIYVEDVDTTELSHERIEFLDFDSTIPEHGEWEKQAQDYENFVNEDVKNHTIRFSHKAFVNKHALQNITTDYGIWLDGDCIFYKELYDNFPKNILSYNFLACQLEIQPGEAGNHIESGILVFDMKHPNTAKFAEGYINNYNIENLKKFYFPFDGYIINRTLEELNLPYTNLNERYGHFGIQGQSENTFLNPELKKRFKHNIGANGKEQYEDWSKVKNADDVFRNLSEHLKKTNARELNIKRLYIDILGREADESGLKHYYESGRSMDEIRDVFVNSDEYKNKKNR